ncbi:hypothetical protein MGN70_010930 [Eutypa lata]|uniref:Putative microtubule-associated protein rp eb family member 1 protein n=1 Tax=Eutypa lata (strain UCR-EL1) TaxID=1287681 RepID=M7SWT5_EUTLA|nr:putative microtubule-associated protein rp eb family member 1 protein [Eutypa lata UCREL1]KAI1247045.1 hypothetical protein MGN70_010930 [Eutypa lata]
MGESRQELVSWLNSLTQLQVQKVEQCGTGAALCVVFDSIFGDLRLDKVKFNANTEYQYITNFKELQNCFNKHHVDKPIPVQALIKCKMQDNLEFLQWSKRFWDQHYPGGDYDAMSRRKGGAALPNTGGPGRVTTSAAGRRGGTTPTTGGPRIGRAAGGGAASAALMQENATLKETVVGLERERDFYFSKLRDIELLVQQAVDEDPELEKAEDGLIKQIQTILYSTEEGFEIPAEGEGLDDQETF